MRPRTLLVLFVLVAGLGAFIWFFEREVPSTDERVEQGKKLVQLDPDSVRALRMTAGDQLARLEREAAAGDAPHGEWTLTEPRTGRADADEVESFLEGVRNLEKERTLADAARDQLGLDAPRAQVTIETESEEVVLRFGSEVPASSKTIVEIGNGPPFYVVADSLLEDISRDPNDWRSRDAIPIERAQIKRIEILNPPAGVTLERGEDGFRISQPIADLADEKKVSDLLTALVELEIEEFDSPTSDFSTQPPAVRLTVEDTAEPVLVEVAPVEDADDIVAVRVDGEVFRAKTDLAAMLDFQPTAWQSTSWSDRDVFEVEGLRVKQSGTEMDLKRREGKWLRGATEVDYSSVSALLYAVTGASGVPVDSASRHASESAELEIQLESSAWTEALRLWADGESDLAEREGRTTLIRLAPETTADVLAKLEALQAAFESAGENKESG